MSIRVLLVFGILYQMQAKAQTYFPSLTGSAWDTVATADLGWCEDKIDSLYGFLDSNQTKGFILLQNGHIALEKYFGTYTKDSIGIWNSAGKSLRAVLIGLAQEQGLLSINDKVSDYIGNGWTGLSQSAEDSIKIWHQLTMTSGLDENNFFCTSPSCLNYVAPAGDRWAYHNGPYALTKDVLEAATGVGHNIYCNAFESHIGMNGYWLNFLGNSFYYSTCRDMARFGLLVSNKGIWDTDTVIRDTAYMNQMLNSSQSLNPSYGYLWWLNGKSSYVSTPPTTNVTGAISLDAPSDIFVAAGSQGQFISVCPSLGLIMIRQGLSNNSNYTEFTMHNEIWRYILDLSCVTSLTELNGENRITLYPNPANSHLYISRLSGESYKVYTLSGKLIREGAMDGNRILVSDLNNGTYFIQLKGQTFKFIKLGK